MSHTWNPGCEFFHIWLLRLTLGLWGSSVWLRVLVPHSFSLLHSTPSRHPGHPTLCLSILRWMDISAMSWFFPTNLIIHFMILMQAGAFIRALCRVVWFPRSLRNCEHFPGLICFGAEIYIYLQLQVFHWNTDLGGARARERKGSK